MRGWTRLLVSLLVLAGLLMVPGLASADAGSKDYVPGQLVVMTKPNTDVAKLAARHGATVQKTVRGHDLVLLKLPASSNVEQAALAMGKDRDVVQAGPNYTLQAPEAQQFSIGFSGRFYYPASGGSPIDPLYADQWSVAKLGLASAQARTTGEGVLVAVLDTGVDASHPALAGHLSAGWDFVDNDADPTEAANGLDDDRDGYADEAAGHGTFVAGIVALVAPGSTIIPIRVMDSEGNGTLFAVTEGIAFAVDQGAQIINLSLGTPSGHKLLASAVDDAASQGTVVVAAVGNHSPNTGNTSIMYPARYEQAVAVAGTDTDDILSAFSNYGRETDLSAPGSGIYSTYLGHGYAWWSGTSASAAFVSGGAALLKAQHTEWGPAQVVGRLQSTAFDNYPDNERYLKDKLGAGRIDLDRATAP